MTGIFRGPVKLVTPSVGGSSPVCSPPPGPTTPIFSDRWLLVVHKPAGLLVHRSRLDAQEGDDLTTRLRAEFGEALSPAHRLDKGTSGVLAYSRDAATTRLLADAFAAGQVRKQYLALVRGWPADAGEIDQPLARDPELPSTGQPQLAATTRWQVLQRLAWPVATRTGFAETRVALVAVTPLTGRRHQIRRHFKHLAHPLIGDATHGKGPLNRALAAWLGLNRLWLHAWRLELPHPQSGTVLALCAEPGPEWGALPGCSLELAA